MEIGSVVTLRSGGPQMTVTDIPSEGQAVCTWFGGSKNSELRVGNMPTAALRNSVGIRDHHIDVGKFIEGICSTYGDIDGRRIGQRFSRLLSLLDFRVKWAVVLFDRASDTMPTILEPFFIPRESLMPDSISSYENPNQPCRILQAPGPKNPELWEQHSYPMELTNAGPAGESRHGMLRIWVAPEDTELSKYGFNSSFTLEPAAEEAAEIQRMFDTTK